MTLSQGRVVAKAINIKSPKSHPKPWNNSTMRFILVGILALSIIGCGKSETVAIGEAGEKGTYQRQIDTSKETASDATAKVQQDNKEWDGSK